MERTYYALNLDLEMHWHCEDNDHIWASYLSESFVMRCFGIVRTIPTSSSSWPMDHALDLMVCFYRSWDDFGYLYEDDIVLTRLWSTLWIGYYSGRKTSAIQLYLADLHWQCRTEHSILHWSWETVRCYLYVENWFGERTLCSDYVLYPEEGCTDTLCESLRSWEVSQLVTSELVIHVWMRTSLFWELLEVFRWFWIHLVKLSFVDF